MPMKRMHVPAVVKGSDKLLPSGTWSWGPITVKWSIQDNDGIDITVSIFGSDIDTLTGTLTQNDAKLEDTIDVLGIIKGTLGLEAKFNQGTTTDGLWIIGELKVPGFDTGLLNHRIIPW